MENSSTIQLNSQFPNRVSPLGQEPPKLYTLDDERHSRTVKFEIFTKEDSGVRTVKGYFIVGFYADGYPGELQIFVSKQGMETHGWTNVLGKAISMLLQYGIPLEEIYREFKMDEFEPCGITNIAQARFCKSIIDMIIRYMEVNFPVKGDEPEDGEYFVTIDAVTEP